MGNDGRALMIDVDGVLVDSFKWEVRMLSGALRNDEFEEDSAHSAPLLQPIVDWIGEHHQSFDEVVVVTGRQYKSPVEDILTRAGLPLFHIATRSRGAFPVEHKYRWATILKSQFGEVVALEDDPAICFALGFIDGVMPVRVPGYPMGEDTPETADFIPELKEHYA